MLAPGKVLEVQKLLAEGRLSQRKIAKVLGVSRATVGAIASGKRPDYAARQRAREAEFEPLGPIERCPTCGGRVYMPCRLCRVRDYKAREQQRLKALRRQARRRALRRLLAAVQEAGASSEQP
ncbi:MAG: helix-turn-helix domain-containing protein [Planctomycetota bacterium]|nr:MAG: helix-turn-helix domain-containing protein [Planctomycetota bacterium]